MIDLEHELADLKARVAHLETTVRKLAGGEPSAALEPGQKPSREELLVWLQARGVIGELPPEARTIAERWQALPEDERRAIQWELDHLPVGPLASDIIIENRR
jgi:hypothetical protein